MESIQYGELADVTGRYYAMDRDKRWERIKVAYDGLISGTGELVDDANAAKAVSFSQQVKKIVIIH